MIPANPQELIVVEAGAISNRPNRSQVQDFATLG
jgi:hypothetical protein